jgi:hypothetical protein
MQARGTPQTTLLGAYPHIMQNSFTNLSSAADVTATVAACKRLGQTVIGMFVDECYYYQLLHPLLEAADGTGISVFGMIRSHNGPIYCPSVYTSVNGSAAVPSSGQQVNWTHAFSTLATISTKFPHFIGVTIDDFYCMMQNDESPPNPFDPKLSVATMQVAHSAMKAIAPRFLFMPTVYPNFLGVYAAAFGYTLGVGPSLPFDTNTSASVTLTLPPTSSAATATSGSVGFWLSSGFSYYEEHGGAFNPVWRGKLFVRSALTLANGTIIVLADVDVFHLTGCGKGDIGSEHITNCIPQTMMRVNASFANCDEGWKAFTIEVYARDAVNLNYYNSKIVTAWNITFDLQDDNARPLAPPRHLLPSFHRQDSAATFKNASNLGKVKAQDNSAVSIAPACDGLLFPFAENGGLVYTANDYTKLLGLALHETQGRRGQQFWALHYGWMWPGAFGGAGQVDPHSLASMIAKDRAAEVDAVLVWGLKIEVGNIAAQRGLFTQRRADAAVTAAAKMESNGQWGAVAQAWFPGYTGGYGGFFQRWTSRSIVSGNETILYTIGLDRAYGSGLQHAVLGNASAGAWFFGAVIRVMNGPVLYNASTGVIVCKNTSTSSDGDSDGNIDSSNSGSNSIGVECPGMDTAAADAAGIECKVRCATLDSAAVVPLAFPEIVAVRVRDSGSLKGAVRLLVEFYEHKGVGNYAGGAAFALSTPSSAWCDSKDLQDEQAVHARVRQPVADTGDAVEGWHFDSGVREPSLLANYWAASTALRSD